MIYFSKDEKQGVENFNKTIYIVNIVGTWQSKQTFSKRNRESKSFLK